MRVVLLVLFLFLFTPGKSQSIVEIWHWLYSYDPSTARNSKQTKYSLTTEHYNNKGQLIEIRRNVTKDQYYKTLLGYNDAGQKTKEIVYYTATANPNSAVISNYTYYEQGLLRSMTFRQRNKKGDSLETVELYFYEGNDLVKKLRKISPYNSTETWDYTYEMVKGNKRVTESHTLAGGRKKKKRIKEYNEKGLLILEIGVGGQRTEYAYTYDINGNWVTRKECNREEVFSPWRCSELRKNLLK